MLTSDWFAGWLAAEGLRNAAAAASCLLCQQLKKHFVHNESKRCDIIMTSCQRMKTPANSPTQDVLFHLLKSQRLDGLVSLSVTDTRTKNNPSVHTMTRNLFLQSAAGVKLLGTLTRTFYGLSVFYEGSVCAFMCWWVLSVRLGRNWSEEKTSVVHLCRTTQTVFCLIGCLNQSNLKKTLMFYPSRCHGDVFVWLSSAWFFFVFCAMLLSTLRWRRVSATVFLKQLLFKPTIKNSFIIRPVHQNKVYIHKDLSSFSESSKQFIVNNLFDKAFVQFLGMRRMNEWSWQWGSQQDVKVFQKKFLQPALRSRGASRGPLPAAAAAAARSRSTWTLSCSPSPRGKFSSSTASFSTCRRSERRSSASEERDMSCSTTEKWHLSIISIQYLTYYT